MHCLQVDDDPNLQHYSRATRHELSRWAFVVSGGGSPSKQKERHAATVVAAIEFICTHEQDQGGLAASILDNVQGRP